MAQKVTFIVDAQHVQAIAALLSVAKTQSGEACPTIHPEFMPEYNGVLAGDKVAQFDGNRLYSKQLQGE